MNSCFCFLQLPSKERLRTILSFFAVPSGCSVDAFFEKYPLGGASILRAALDQLPEKGVDAEIRRSYVIEQIVPRQPTVKEVETTVLCDCVFMLLIQ